MERIEERLAVAHSALGTLEELTGLGPEVTEVERDATIKRFEYTFETVWKAAQIYLRQMEGLDVGSPKGVIRASLSIGLLTENEAKLGLEMTDDRNLAVHVYNRDLAKAISDRIPEYAKLMGKWLEAMDEML